MLEFLKTLHQEAVTSVQTMDVYQKSEDVKVNAAILRTRLQIFSMLYHLPDNIKKAEEQIKLNQTAKLKFAEAQESGDIGGTN